MAKRARCPHCDRLFPRDVLDEHIRKCKHRERSRSLQKAGSRRLVVDGNNVAYYLSTDGKPHIRNLLLAHNSLTGAGYRPLFVISAALAHKIDKPQDLISFLSQVDSVRAARGTDDDLEIIETAQKQNADIVSNDRFLNWIERYPWISDRLRRYRMTPAGLILTHNRT